MMKVGNVVKLKGQTNSPTMTVSILYTKLGKATCVWFVDTTLFEGSFGIDALVVIRE